MSTTFIYKAKDRSGQLLTGSILADSEAAVASYIREKGYFVTQIKKKSSSNSIEGLLENLHRVSTKDLAVVCRQISTMVDAGLSLVACLNILIEQSTNPRLKTALQDVYKKVKEGEMLSRALADHANIFPAIMINMVEAGEVGGVLDDVLGRLATHFEKEHKLNEKVKSAMTYPAVVLSMAFIVVIFILTFVLPTFMQMFIGMKMELPLPTKILMGLSEFLREYALLLFIAFLLSSIGLAITVKKPKARKTVDELILKMPIFGVLARKIAIARFSRTLSTLVRGGVPILSALEVVKKTMGNLSMVDALGKAQVNVKEGIGLAQTLGSSKVFTPMVIQMVAIGEESGSLDKMLEKIADFYESEVDDMVGRLSSILEPVIVGILGVVIGFIVIAVVIPLFDVITNVGNM
ncbi:MAG: type II secretion system F family protein [Negativicutes bacterium]|jgi:type IV pilus assembly protein PilC